MTQLFNFWGPDATLVALGCLALALMLQTTLLLALGMLGLHALQKRKPGACTLPGRLLLLAALSLCALSGGLTLNNTGRVPVLWNIRLPLSPTTGNPSTPQPPYLSFPTDHLKTFPSTEQPTSPRLSLIRPHVSTRSEGSTPLQDSKEKRASSAFVAERNLNPTSSPSSPPQVANILITTLQLVTVIWLGGAVVLLLWLGLCHVMLWRLRHGARPIVDARMLATFPRICTTLQVPVPSLLSHPEVASPFLMGLWRPAIVLPACAGEMSQEALEAVLFHESAHLKRCDLWWSLLGRVLCALLWPQPLLWLLCGKLEHISEEACDGAVLRSGLPPQLYATCLLDWAGRQMPRQAQRVAGAGVLTGHSSLARRLQSILANSHLQSTSLSRRAQRTIIGATVVAVVAMPLLVASNPLETAPSARRPRNVSGSSRASTGSTRQPLQHFKETDGYRVYIQGVSGGILQGVSLIQEKEGTITNLYLARALQRQNGKGDAATWAMSDGVSYTFKQGVGLVSETRFAKTSLTWRTDSNLEAFLSRQTLAEPTPFSTIQWQQTQSRMVPPLGQINALETWAKENGNATLTGRVLDEDGQPVGGAQVEIQISEQTLQSITHSPKKEGYGRIYSYLFALSKATRNLLLQNTTTGSDGTYRFEGLGTAPYRLEMGSYGRIARANYDVPAPAQVLTASHQVVPRANQATTAPDLVMTRGGLVRVRVEDKDTGAVLADATVSASSNKASPPYVNGHSYMVDTDAKGESLFRLPPGAGAVSIGEQYLPELRGFATPSKRGPYKVNGNAEAVVDGGTPQSFPGALGIQISPDQTREVVIRLQRFVAPTPTPAPRRVPPPAGKGVLLGRVVNEAGQGMGGIPLFAIMQQKSQWRLMQGVGLAYSNDKTPHADEKWASIQGVLSQSTRTRADGSFRFDGLTTAPYNLVVATGNGSFGLRPPSGWVAPAVEGTWAREGQVVRRARPIVVTPGALIEGRILDKATGLPLGGIDIGSNGPQLPTSTDDVMSAKSDAQGKFTLRVAPGTTSLYIAGPNSRGSEENMVYADTGQSANAYEIGTSRGLFAGSEGVQFEIDDGSSEVGLNMKGRPEGRIEIPLQSGQTRRLTLHLRRLKPKPKN